MSDTRKAVEEFLSRQSVRDRVRRTTGASALNEAGLARKSIDKDKTFVPFLETKATMLLQDALESGLPREKRAKSMEEAVDTVTEYVEGKKNLGNFGPCACEGMRVRVNKTDATGHRLNGRAGVVRREYQGGRKWTLVALEKDDGTMSGEEIQIEEIHLKGAGEVFTVEDWIVTKHRSAERACKRRKMGSL
jgi:hypothetical protein